MGRRKRKNKQHEIVDIKVKKDKLEDRDKDKEDDDDDNIIFSVSRNVSKFPKEKRKFRAKILNDSSSSSSDDDSKRERVIHYLSTKDRHKRVRRALAKMKEKQMSGLLCRNVDQSFSSRIDNLQDSSSDEELMSKPKQIRRKTKTKINTSAEPSKSDIVKGNSSKELGKTIFSVSSDSNSEKSSTSKKKHRKLSDDFNSAKFASQSTSLKKNDPGNNPDIVSSTQSPILGTRKSRRIQNLEEKKRNRVNEDIPSSLSIDSDSNTYITSEEEGVSLLDTDNESSDESLNEPQLHSTDIIDDQSSKEDSGDDEIPSSNQLQHHMNYAAMNFALDMKNEMTTSEKDIVQESLGRLRNMTTKEAFEVWIKDIAKQVEDCLQQKINEATGSTNFVDPYVSSRKALAASTQIEKPLCTYRESTLASTAWTKSFRTQLKSRPAYAVYDLNSSEKDTGFACEACGRSNHNVSCKVIFSGTTYDASRTYEIDKRVRHTDWERCLRENNCELSTSDSINSGNDESAPVQNVFKIGKYCRARSQLYHSLLHHKYNVFCKIGEKILGKPLKTFYANLHRTETRRSGRIKLKVKVKDLMRDRSMITKEFENYQTLLQKVSDEWCHSVPTKTMDVQTITSSHNNPSIHDHTKKKEKVRKRKKNGEKKLKKKLKKQKKKLEKIKKKLKKHKQGMRKK